MNDFGREPKRLMKSIKSFLNTTRGIAAKRSRDKYGTAFWLYWRKDDVARALGIEWHMKWELTFSHRNVRAGLYFELNGKTRPILERIEEYAAAGVTKFVMRPIAEDDEDLLEQTRRLADEVLPTVHGE